MSNSAQIQPIFLPGGILSPDRLVGYFTNINNGIDAIDLHNGSVLWTSDVSFRPLLATNNWLVAQKSVPDLWNAIEIVKLDLNTHGSLLWRSGAIVFPEWVRASHSTHEQYINLNFQVRATIDRLFLDWQAQNYYYGGAAPPPSILAESAQNDRGIVGIDINAGAVEMLPLADSEDTSIVEQLPPGGWIVGEKIVYLTSDRIEGQQGVELRIRDRSGSRGVETIIELGRGKSLHYLVTLDRCYIFVCPDIYADVEQPWWIFAAETGQLMATVTYDLNDRAIGIRSLSIFNSQIYYLVDRPIDPLTHQSVLKVKDLSSGKLCWEYLVEPPKIQLPNLP